LFYPLGSVLAGSSPLCFWLGRLLSKEEEAAVGNVFFFFQIAQEKPALVVVVLAEKGCTSSL
jgi:hypothetical protein